MQMCNWRLVLPMYILLQLNSIYYTSSNTIHGTFDCITFEQSVKTPVHITHLQIWQ